jgi:hypothetical protein
MRKGPPTSSPPLVCSRCFEAARLAPQFFVVAYKQLVPELRRSSSVAAVPSKRRPAIRSRKASISSQFSEGVRA